VLLITEKFALANVPKKVLGNSTKAGYLQEGAGRRWQDASVMDKCFVSHGCFHLQNEMHK
jgi:hypothetical protein